jgi:hypothetical protein
MHYAIDFKFKNQVKLQYIMTELEKAMRQKYEYNHLGLTSKRDEKDLIELKWTEKLILKKKGKLTILDENETKHKVVDKIRE